MQKELNSRCSCLGLKLRNYILNNTKRINKLVYEEGFYSDICHEIDVVTTYFKITFQPLNSHSKSHFFFFILKATFDR